MKIKLVNQECDKSCVIACIAMVTGNTFADVRKLFKEIPVSNTMQMAALAHFGYFSVKARNDLIYHDCLSIVDVPSLNMKRVMHSVVVDARNCEGNEFRLYDPQAGREGKEFYMAKDLLCWGGVHEIYKAEDILNMKNL